MNPEIILYILIALAAVRLLAGARLKTTTTGPDGAKAPSGLTSLVLMAMGALVGLATHLARKDA